MRPDAVQIRVLGALLEKQRTTPDTYPLTLNALRAACNQSTNREPVVDYDERMIRAALEELGRRRWTRNASGPGSRAPKYRHLLADSLQIQPDDQAILAVLMLRGPQTPGELRARTERLHRFTDQQAVDGTIERLIGRGLVERMERRPGQKEVRYRQLLGGEEDAGGASIIGGTVAAAPGAPAAGGAVAGGGGGGGGAAAGGAAGGGAGGGVAGAGAGGAVPGGGSPPVAPGAGAGTPAASPATGAPVAGGGPAGTAAAPAALPPAAQAEIAALRGRVDALESEVSRLRSAFRRLQEELGG